MDRKGFVSLAGFGPIFDDDEVGMRACGTASGQNRSSGGGRSPFRPADGTIEQCQSWKWASYNSAVSYAKIFDIVNV